MSHFARTIFPKKRVSALSQFITFVQGVIMGIVELVPGVGIATLSLSFNIYHEFTDVLHDISSFFKEIGNIFLGKFNKKSFNKSLNAIFSDFSIPLILGIIFGLAIFSFIFRFTLENFPAYTRALFFGLVIASIPVPFRQIKKIKHTDVVLMLLFFLIFFYLFGFHTSNIFLIPTNLQVFISGFFSPLTLFLPGLGGSFAILLFGTYPYLVNTLFSMFFGDLTSGQLMNISLFLIGFFIGFMIIVRTLKRLIKKHRNPFMASLVGIMAASLRFLYPFITVKGDMTLIVAPWSLPVGHSILIVTVLAVSFIVTKVLNSLNFKDPVEDI